MSLFVVGFAPVPQMPVTPPAIIQAAATTEVPDMVFDGSCLVAQSTKTPLEPGVGEPGVGEPGDFSPAQDISLYFSNVRNIIIKDWGQVLHYDKATLDGRGQGVKCWIARPDPIAVRIPRIPFPI